MDLRLLRHFTDPRVYLEWMHHVLLLLLKCPLPISRWGVGVSDWVTKLQFQSKKVELLTSVNGDWLTAVDRCTATLGNPKALSRRHNSERCSLRWFWRCHWQVLPVFKKFVSLTVVQVHYSGVCWWSWLSWSCFCKAHARIDGYIHAWSQKHGPRNIQQLHPGFCAAANWTAAASQWCCRCLAPSLFEHRYLTAESL